MVRTRFAPSPTGYLHIGGVRTALFNWLFARQHHGQFILRIDDTDQQRNVQQALQPILDGFRWLGIDWDEGPDVGGPHEPYFQSQRLEHYQSAVQSLLGRGAAYYDYATPDELQRERQEAEKAGRPFLYSRRWMATTSSQRQQLEAQGRAGVVRLKMPREGTVVIEDGVRGRVEFAWDQEQDHVIQRADGSVLYHLASVVDDHALRITHVIRAEEHLSNTPRQVFLAQSLGYPLPHFAHLPQVAEPGSRLKLSKRKLDKYLKHRDFAALQERGRLIAQRLGLQVNANTFNPVLIDFYRIIGFLPHAVLNYLLLLGWSLDDRTELLEREEMIRAFSLQRVGKSPASFDPQKLLAFQAHYMARLPLKEKTSKLVDVLQAAGYLPTPVPCQEGERVRKIVQAAGERIVLLGDILEYHELFCDDDQLTYDAKALEKRLVKPPEARQLLGELRGDLEGTEPFEAETLEATVRQFVQRKGIKIGQIIHTLRVAVTGKAIGFGMFETLEILGRQHCLRRIDRALELAGREEWRPGDKEARR